jgi:pullulanase/glycogen debranching enzyme
MNFRKLFFFHFFFLLFSASFSQSFTPEEQLQGYALTKDTLFFILDENTYQIQPEKVFVTGAFRNWDTNLDVTEWELKKVGSLWLLAVYNADFSRIKPNSPFKYRINEGEWLSPPTEAENVSAGNLVFLKEENYLTAELRSDNLIWADIKADRSLDPADYIITDASGKEIKVSKVLPNGATSTLIIPEESLDRKRVYFLEVPSKQWKTPCSFDGWFRETYSDKALGATVTSEKTNIRLFAPRADSVNVYLYKEKDDANWYHTQAMIEDTQGVWEIEFPENLHGIYYDFTIHGAQDPGNHFYETNPVHVNDPYTRVSDDTWGKGRIWEKTRPAEPLKNGIPKMEDVIAYEVHVQDFTDLLPIENKYKGTFKGMTLKGLKNDKGQKIGFDYLVDLGINVLHLLPVQEYSQFPTEDWYASFKDDIYMISQGIQDENYQWGYRTSYAMAVESRYKTKGSEPGQERDEFRDLVEAFHQEGIAVIIDIVPNHTAENMTPEQQYFNFNAIDKLYYYRTKDFNHIGEYGNEVKTENRPMTQRWLIDQCLYFIEEFGVDGFRIDLAGQIDQQTLSALKSAIGEDKILYGEPWIGSNDPNFENNPDWDWYKEDSPITFFQDDSRNAFKGPVFELNSKEKDRGWAGGKFDERENVMKGLSNTFKEDKTPLSGINYLDIHDNFALADQFGARDFDGRLAVDQEEYKIAATLLYTSLGPIVTHGGSEIMRSKAMAPLMEVVKETNGGIKNYFHGKRDTYNLRAANQFRWEQVGQEPTEENTNDYKKMLEFWKGLNEFRLSEIGKVFRVSERMPETYYQWILPADESMLGYVVADQVLVLINAGNTSNSFEGIQIPLGQWKLIGNNEEINPKEGINTSIDSMLIKEDQKINISLEKTSIQIWVKK